MGKLEKVVIELYTPADFGAFVTNPLNRLPWAKIKLLLVVDYTYLDPKDPLNNSRDLREEWGNLDNLLGDCIIPGLSQENPLHFYVVDNLQEKEWTDNKQGKKWTGGRGGEWTDDLLPRFTRRPDVIVDPSLKEKIY